MLCKFVTRLTRDERGAAAVELAFALPVFLAASYMFLEAARLIYTQGALMFAAQEATRYATVHYDAEISELQAVATDRSLALDKTKLTGINVDSILNEEDQSKRVTVELSYSYSPMLPLIPGGTITLQSASRGFLVEK